jgi:hypothetical protein
MKRLTLNNSGKKYLVENCKKVSISDLLGQYRKEFKKIFLRSNFEIFNVKIGFTTSKTFYGGKRFWFKCPLCNGRVGILYKHPLNKLIGCRKCLKLEYRSRLYKGMIEEKLANL